MDAGRPPKPVRFGVFELDTRTGELRKQGVKVRVPEQSLQILSALLEHPGELVTREELQKKLWPDDTIVEFDHSINAAIKRLRQALGDLAETPRFVETLPRRGYRFLAPVEKVEDGGRQRRFARRRILLVAECLACAVVLTAAVIAVWVVRSKTGAPEADLVAVPLTSYPGTETYPTFCPDGTQVAFQWCPADPGKSCDIYVKQIGVEPPFQLTDTPEMEYSPVWSPDGRTIAFLRRLDPARRALVLIPQRGGRERVLEEQDISRVRESGYGGPYLAWTPDSKWLVFNMFNMREAGHRGLYLFSVETREKRQLTNPPASVTDDMAPAFSPDGRILAFTRFSEAGPAADLYLLRLGEGYRPLGEPERVRMNAWYAAWTPDGGEIVFASYTGLWRMALSKSATPRRLPFAPDNVREPAISRPGNRLAYSVERSVWNIWRLDLREPGHKPGTPVPFISSTRSEGDQSYSPDGDRIAFVSGRSGSPEIWVCDANGSNAVQLTFLGRPFVQGPRWSPDSRNIVFQAEPGRNPDIYVISAAGGVPRRLTTEPSFDMWPYWSHDGQWIYFVSNRSGSNQIWKMPASGGKAIQITRNGGGMPQESADGKFVYYSKGYPAPVSVWRMPLDGGEETKILGGVHPLNLWTLGKEGIYFFTVPDKQGHSDLSIHEFATGKTRKILTIERKVAGRLDVSPDGRAVLYSQLHDAGSDLMLVENFR